MKSRWDDLNAKNILRRKGCIGLIYGNYEEIVRSPEYQEMWEFSVVRDKPIFKAPRSLGPSHLKIMGPRRSLSEPLLRAAAPPSPRARYQQSANKFLINVSDDSAWTNVAGALSCALAADESSDDEIVDEATTLDGARNIIIMRNFVEKVPMYAKANIQRALKNTPHLVMIFSNDDMFLSHLCSSFVILRHDSPFEILYEFSSVESYEKTMHVYDVEVSAPDPPLKKELVARYGFDDIYDGDRIALINGSKVYTPFFEIFDSKVQYESYDWLVDFKAVSSLRKLKYSALEFINYVLSSEQKSLLEGKHNCSVHEVVRKALDEFGLPWFRQCIPMVHLSRNEHAAIVICFAFLCEPPLLVLDDPSQYMNRRLFKVLVNKINTYPRAVLCRTDNITLIQKTKMRVMHSIEHPKTPPPRPKTQTLRMLLGKATIAPKFFR